MNKLTRRDFLKVGMTGMGALTLGQVLAACGKANPSSQATNTAIPATTLPVASQEGPTSTPGNTPDLVVVRGGEPEALVRSALAALGGMERFVQPGQKVVVKPNVCTDYRSYEYAATTNPWVVGTLVKMAFEAGAASVKVFDFPFGGEASSAYVTSGIQEQVEAAGGEMLPMPEFRFVAKEIPNGIRLKKTRVFDEIINTDVLINVPIAKDHGEAILTLGMKNLMGLVLDRGAMHVDLGQCIADLNSLIRPQLTVIDAVRLLAHGGPSGGNLSWVTKMDTVIAGTDVVAADCYVSTNLFAFPGKALPYVKAGVEMNLGRSDLENLNIQEISLSA